MFKEEIIPDVHVDQKLIIRLHIDSAYTHFGMPYASQGGIDLIASNNAAEYKEEIIYINNTYRIVNVMNRSGMVIAVRYSSSCSSRDFIIRKIIRLKGLSLSSVISNIQSQTNIDSAELLEIKRCLENIDPDTQQGASIMLDYITTIEELNAKGGSVYHYNTDTVLSFNDPSEMPMHPYSTQFLNIGTFGVQNTYADQAEFNVKLRYVNHDRHAGPVYINTLGKVFKLFPQKDSPVRKFKLKDKTGKHFVKTFDDYIQVFYGSRNDPDQIGDSGVSSVKYTLEEAKEKIGVYDTYADALNNGNIDITRKEQILNLTHELEILRQNNNIEKVKLEREDSLRKAELNQLNHALEIERKNLDNKTLEQKQIQLELDAKLLKIENEKRELVLKQKEQDEYIQKESKLFEERLKSLREDHQYKLETDRQYWKDFYDKKNQERTDNSNNTKFVLAIAASVIGGVFGLFKMFAPVTTK